jgi:FMN-dependent NADH-azoreductase
MAKLLVVRAHPLTSEFSRSMQLADEFVRVYAATHPDDDVLDLNLYVRAVPEIDLDLLSAWQKLGAGTPFIHLTEPEQLKVTLFDGYTSQFVNVDRVVVANPLWNLQVPTRLKAWIDTISVAGQTFEYTADGVAVGLVRGKRVVHIQTSGGVFGGLDPASAYLRTIFTFLGVEDYQEIYAEGMDHDPEHAAEIVAAALARVAEAAAAF